MGDEYSDYDDENEDYDSNREDLDEDNDERANTHDYEEPEGQDEGGQGEEEEGRQIGQYPSQGQDDVTFQDGPADSGAQDSWGGAEGPRGQGGSSGSRLAANYGQAAKGGANGQYMPITIAGTRQPSGPGNLGDSVGGSGGGSVPGIDPNSHLGMLYKLGAAGNKQAQQAFISALGAGAKLTQSENIRMSRLQQAASAVDADDTKSEQEKRIMKAQIMAGLNPLLMKKQAAEAQQKEAQVDQYMKNMALVEGINAKQNELNAKAKLAGITQGPQGQHLYVNDKTGKIEPVPGSEGDPHVVAAKAAQEKAAHAAKQTEWVNGEPPAKLQHEIHMAATHAAMVKTGTGPEAKTEFDPAKYNQTQKQLTFFHMQDQANTLIAQAKAAKTPEERAAIKLKLEPIYNRVMQEAQPTLDAFGFK